MVLWEIACHKFTGESFAAFLGVISDSCLQQTAPLRRSCSSTEQITRKTKYRDNALSSANSKNSPKHFSVSLCQHFI